MRTGNNNEYDASVFIITSGNDCVEIDEYRDGDGDGVFVMLTNETLDPDFGDDNSILIYRDWVDTVHKAIDSFSNKRVFKRDDIYVTCPWQMSEEGIPHMSKLNSRDDTNLNTRSSEDELTYFGKIVNGWKTCNDILSNVTGILPDNMTIDSYVPAIMLAYHSIVRFGGKIRHGYLPSIGQMTHLYHNLEKVDTALNLIDAGTSTIRTIGYWDSVEYWWTSNEYDHHYVLRVDLCNPYVTFINKTCTSRVLPIYKI